MLPHPHLGDPTPKPLYLDKMVFGIGSPLYPDNYLDKMVLGWAPNFTYHERTMNVLSDPKEVGISKLYVPFAYH